MALTADELAAIRKYGPGADRVAARYTNPVNGKRLSGAALLAKLVTGESGGDPNAVSSAGARGIAQFIPGTRKTVMDRFGIDPWGSADDAVHAAVLHLTGKLGNAQGLEGYNPGGGEDYVNYILGQHVGKVAAGSGSAPSAAAAPGAPAATGATPGTSPQQGMSQGGVAAVLQQLIGGQQQQRPVVSAPAAPSFTARPVLPQAYSPAAPEVPVEAARQQQAATQDLLRQATVALSQTGQAPATGGGGAPAAAGGKQQVLRVKPGVPVADLSSEGAEHATEGLPGFPAHDFMAPAGSPAVAPVSGKVVRFSGHDPKGGPTEGPHGPFGWSVYIQGDDGRTYYLTHMGSRSIKVGQTVRQGQVIGTVGDYAKWGGADHIHQGVSG